MGWVDTIAADRWPKQSGYVGERAQILFHYREPALEAVIVRDDLEQPWQTIFRLDDGRIVLASECQYRLPSEGA